MTPEGERVEVRLHSAEGFARPFDERWRRAVAMLRRCCGIRVEVLAGVHQEPPRAEPENEHLTA